MKTRDFLVTPNRITELSSSEVFVFGSNLQGYHGGGAARTAMDKFGAEWGVGAKEHPDTRFLVTRIGCGIAGFRDAEIAPLFAKAVNLPNVALPRFWWNCLGAEV